MSTWRHILSWDTTPEFKPGQTVYVRSKSIGLVDGIEKHVFTDREGLVEEVIISPSQAWDKLMHFYTRQNQGEPSILPRAGQIVVAVRVNVEGLAYFLDTDLQIVED